MCISGHAGCGVGMYMISCGPTIPPCTHHNGIAHDLSINCSCNIHVHVEC